MIYRDDNTIDSMSINCDIKWPISWQIFFSPCSPALVLKCWWRFFFLWVWNPAWHFHSSISTGNDDLRYQCLVKCSDGINWIRIFGTWGICICMHHRTKLTDKNGIRRLGDEMLRLKMQIKRALMAAPCRKVDVPNWKTLQCLAFALTHPTHTKSHLWNTVTIQ